MPLKGSIFIQRCPLRRTPLIFVTALSALLPSLFIFQKNIHFRHGWNANYEFSCWWPNISTFIECSAAAVDRVQPPGHRQIEKDICRKLYWVTLVSGLRRLCCLSDLILDTELKESVPGPKAVFCPLSWQIPSVGWSNCRGKQKAVVITSSVCNTILRRPV